MSLTRPSTSSSSTCLLDGEDQILFRYTWPLRVKRRLMASGENTILNVSPPFCTAYNGVQFTWLIRVCDEFILDTDDENESNRRLVNITLYYKDGPAQDIQLSEAKFSVNDSTGHRRFSNIALESLDYIKGCGWAHYSENSAERTSLSSFIQDNSGKNISIIMELKIKVRWFLPFEYLPDIDGRDSQLQAECENVLNEMLNGKLTVPDVELFDITFDRYAFHRHCFLFGCKETARRCQHLSVCKNEVENVFANRYFNQVLTEEAECFEDFVDLLVASFVIHFPALKRECERYICRELMLESADDAFVKKMLLLAERFNLKVLKMVAFGMLVDRFIDANHTKRGSVEEIRDELLQLAEEIKTNDDNDKIENADEVVSSVIDQLEELAKHIRKVSMSPDSGCPYLGVAPVCSSPSPLISQGRRSSLKTSRELLTFTSSSALGPWGASSPREHRRRRSVMFSLPNTLDETDQFKGETRTETSSTSSTSLSSRVLPDVDENSLDASQNVRDESEFEVDTQVYNDKSAIFTFEEPFVRCIPNEHV